MGAVDVLMSAPGKPRGAVDILMSAPGHVPNSTYVYLEYCNHTPSLKRMEWCNWPKHSKHSVRQEGLECSNHFIHLE